MLSVVCWKWQPALGYRSKFDASHVNVLKRMVDRHYPSPHRFLCVTDDSRGLDAGIEAVPLWGDFADVPSPHGGQNPSCYRRLRAFSPEIGAIFGPRFVSVDLDTVLVRDVRPLWDRSEDFVIWGETNPKSWYNGSMWMMTTGARKQVWERFDPKTSPQQALKAGKFGSDQGWISYVLGPGEATWTQKDGVYSYRVHVAPQGNRLPKNARMVMFHGKHDPWAYNMDRVPWIQEHYR
jgi:hypothetical protein